MSRQYFLHWRLTIALMMLVFVVASYAFGAEPPVPGREKASGTGQAVGTENASADKPDPQPCVLLRNDNVLFGTATQQGEFVIVRRGPGNEIRLPRKDVACWASSVQNLYRYRVDHRRAGDINAMLKDARWCVRYDLYELADLEIEAILAIAPGHSEAIRLQGQLNRKLTPARTHAWQDSSTVQTVSHVEESQPDLSRVDLVSLTQFGKGIQPMLLNRCGNCHDHTSDRDWTLLKPSAGTRPSSRMTRENLASTLAYINSSTPESTLLWAKAVSPHGGGRAALSPRHGKALAILRHWMMSVQSPVGGSGVFESGSTKGPNEGGAPLPTENDIDPIGDEQQGDESLEPGWPIENSAKSESPRRLPNVANPFDPDLFNRRYHPE